MSERLRTALSELPTPDDDAATAVRARADQVLRPTGALQRLDDVAAHIAGWQGTTKPSIEHPSVLVFAAEHGVASAGVSAYPSDVTGAMLAAVHAGKATINALARVVGADVEAVDVGVGDPTGDIRHAAAVTPERLDDIVTTAFAAVDRMVDRGSDLLVLGELGIGNTTVAAALPAALLGGEAATWVGRGTGVDDEGLHRKRTAVECAVARIRGHDDPIDVMREIGGAELCAMAAACTRARQHRLPVVIDGYVATSALLPLHVARPGALDHCLVGHRSAEPGHSMLLDHLRMQPLLDLGMRLGEGSGALAAVPLIRMACVAVVDVATFGEWFGE